MVAVVLLLSPLSEGQPPPTGTRPPPTGMGPGGGIGNLTCAGNDLVRCPMQPPFPAVNMTTNNQYRLIQTTGCPPYPQNWTVQQETCINPRTIEIPLNPRYASTPVPIVQALSEYQGITYLMESPVPVLGSIGIFDNGVYIYGSSSPCGFGSLCPYQDASAPSTYVDAVDSEGDTIDFCGGHPTPIDLEYHVHSGETFSESNAGRRLCGLPEDTPGEHSVRLGWMYDGFGIYGRKSLNGEVPTDLDQCGGHTHEIDGVMTYHYHIQHEFPWIIGCFKGCPHVANNDRQLSFANSDAYGCPEGLDADPVLTETTQLPGGNGASQVQSIVSTLVLLLAIAVLIL